MGGTWACAACRLRPCAPRLAAAEGRWGERGDKVYKGGRAFGCEGPRGPLATRVAWGTFPGVPPPPLAAWRGGTHLVGGEALPLHEVAWRCIEVRTQEQRFLLQECGAGGAAARQRGCAVIAGPSGGQGRQGGIRDAERRGRRKRRRARKEER